MITTTLNILINGNKPPSPIQVSLVENGRHVLDFSTFKNLIHPFNDLALGNYDLYITGANMHASAATFSLTTTSIILHPPDDTPTTKTQPNYAVTFHFTVTAPS